MMYFNTAKSNFTDIVQKTISNPKYRSEPLWTFGQSLKFIGSCDPDFHAFTESWCEGYAVEILAVWAFIDRHNIEEKEKHDKKNRHRNKTKNDSYALPTSVINVERHIRQESKCQEEAENEAKKVRPVVDHWQESKYKEAKEDKRQL